MNAVKSISSASKPCSSLARRNAAYCQLNLCKSSWMCSTGGGGSLRTAYVAALEARSSHSSCARRRHFSCSNSDRGAKLFVPRVGRLFHQSVVGQSGHDLCSWLLGTAQAQRQKARHHGNKTMLERSTGNIKEIYTKYMFNVLIGKRMMLTNLSTNVRRQTR